MENPIDNTIRVGRRYWFVDGFTEILVGILFILLGGVLLLRGTAPHSSLMEQLTAILGPVSLIKLFGFLAAVLILWWLKNYFTYPRTGFVREKRISLEQIFTFLRNAALYLLLPLLVLVVALLYPPFTPALLSALPAWAPFVMSVVLSVVAILSSRWLGLGRFGRLGIAIILAGTVTAAWQIVIGLPPVAGDALSDAALVAVFDRTFTALGVLIVSAGACIAFAGMVTFLRYRKENPVPYQEEA